MSDKDEIIKNLSDVYVTLEDIQIQGKYSVAMALCLQTIEKTINEIKIKL